jgi:hypothetical protein
MMQGPGKLLKLIVVHDGLLQGDNTLLDIFCDFGEGFIDDEQPAFTMIQGIFDLLPLVSGIDRNSDSTYPKACKVEKKHLRTVGKHHSHSVAMLDPQPQHHLCGFVNSVIECFIAYGLVLAADCYSFWIISGMVLDQLIKNFRSVWIHLCSSKELEFIRIHM